MNAADFLDAALPWESIKCNAVDMLVPNMRGPVRNLLALLNSAPSAKHAWGVFETWRNPIRQAYLVKEGRSKTILSAHNYGMAADIVPMCRDTGHYFWKVSDRGVPAQWDLLDQLTNAQYMLRKPIAWDRPHVQHRDWDTVRKLIK